MTIYRHHELDSYVAKKLMKKLENFKIPKELLEKLPPEKQPKYTIPSMPNTFGFYLDGCMRNGKLFLLGSSSDYVQMYDEGISVESRGKDTIVIKDDKGYSKTLYDISGEFKGITYCSEIDSSTLFCLSTMMN